MNRFRYHNIMKCLVLFVVLDAVAAFAPPVRPRVVSPLFHWAPYPSTCLYLDKANDHAIPNNSTSRNTNDNENQANGTSLATTTGKSILESIGAVLHRIDKVGLSTKPKAKQASVLYTASTGRGARLKYLAQSFLFFTLYIIYYAARGILAIVPLVYQQLYAKFGNVVEYPFQEPDAVMTRDVNPATGTLRWRTRIMVGVLAAVLSASYVLVGALRVGRTAFQSLRQTRSLIEALKASVEQLEDNAHKMQRFADRPLPQPKNYF